MNKSAREAYALVVCFVCLAGMTFTGCVAAFSAVQVYEPTLTVYPGQLQPYQSNDAFKAIGGGAPAAGDAEAENAKSAEEDLTQQRLKALQDVIATERAMGQRNLVIQGLLFLLALIMFGWHWRMAGRERDGLD